MKVLLLLSLLLISPLSPTLLKRSRTLKEDNQQEVLQDIKDAPLPNLNRDLVIRPSNINVNVKEVAFNDTILKLQSGGDIRIKIHVKNGKFLPFFN